MRALVWHGPERMTVENVPAPVVEPGWVIVRPEVVGICGSEIEGYLGRMGNRTPPLVMGHEFAGTVTDVGEGVPDDLIGQRVAVNPLVACGNCRMCADGLSNLCPHRWLVGIQQPGGFAEYARVPAANVVPLSANLNSRVGALAEPLANGVHAVRLGLRDGTVERALVIGGGTIGIMALEAARLLGIPKVGVIEPHEGRRRRATEFGAGATFANAQEWKSAHGEATEIRPDLVLECVGAGTTRALAVELVRPGGLAVFIGLHEDRTDLGFHHIIRNQIGVRGSFAYTNDDFVDAVHFLAEGQAGIGDAYAELSLDEGPETFDRLTHGPVEELKIFLRPTP